MDEEIRPIIHVKYGRDRRRPPFEIDFPQVTGHRPTQ